MCTAPGKSSGWCCFPLSPACMVFSVVLIVLAAIQVYSSETGKTRDSNMFILGIVGIAIGGIMLISILLKIGLVMIITAFVLFGIAIWHLVTLIVKWIEWGNAIDQGRMKLHWTMVVNTILWIFSILFILAVSNIYFSTGMVYRVGGNGWEFKNYTQITKAQSKKQSGEDV